MPQERWQERYPGLRLVSSNLCTGDCARGLRRFPLLSSWGFFSSAVETLVGRRFWLQKPDRKLRSKMMKRMVDPRSIPVLAVLLLLIPPSDACAKTCGCKEWPPKDPSDEDKVGGVQPCKNLNRIPTMFCPRDFPSLCSSHFLPYCCPLSSARLRMPCAGTAPTLCTARFGTAEVPATVTNTRRARAKW